MKYNDNVKRWSLGDGKVFWERYNNIIRIMEKTGEGSAAIRALVTRKGTKKYELLLFQGKGHKDTTYKTNRWMNVRETLGNHLCDIDRALERPLTKFRLPAEEECYGPRRGDVVVIKSGQEEGYIAIVFRKEGDFWVVMTTSFYNESPMGYYGVTNYVQAEDVEVIDHDEGLLLMDEVIEPLDLPGGNWLLAIDCSGSMIQDECSRWVADHEKKLNAKVSQWVFFDEIVKEVVGLDPSEWGRGGTDITCVLEYAKQHGYENILIYTDGEWVEPSERSKYGLNIKLFKIPLRSGKSRDGVLMDYHKTEPETLIEDKSAKDMPDTYLDGFVRTKNPQVVEHNGYEYWLEKTAVGINVWRTCKHCMGKKHLALEPAFAGFPNEEDEEE